LIFKFLLQVKSRLGDQFLNISVKMNQVWLSYLEVKYLNFI